MSQFQSLEVKVRNRVATITLNSPDSLNAIHQQMRHELLDAFEQTEADEDVRVVVLRGAGAGFCAGADLTEGMPGFDNFEAQCEAEWKPLLMHLHDSKKLHVAAVHGACAGIATAFTLSCDLIVMSEDAYIYQAFAAIGLIPDGGATWLLLQKLGYQRALDLIVNAKRLNSSECLEFGIANRVVPRDELFDHVQQWAEQMIEGPPLVQTAAKRVLRRAQTMSYSDVVDLEAKEQDKLIISEDAQSAVKAFFAKSKPVFKGR